MSQNQQGAPGSFWPTTYISQPGSSQPVPVFLSPAGTPMIGATPGSSDAADLNERIAAGNQVKIALPAPAGSPFEYQPGNPAMIYAMPHQMPTAPPSAEAIAAYPGLDDDEAPLLANPALEAKMDKKLRKKMKKWLKRLENDGKNYHESAYPFKQAPLQERLPLYFSASTLICYLIQVVYLSAISFPSYRSTATSICLGIQCFLLLGLYIAQTVLSAKLRFTKGLFITSIIGFCIATFLGFLALILNGSRAIGGGFDFVLVSCVLQALWIHTVRANKKAQEKLNAAPAAPVTAV